MTTLKDIINAPSKHDVDQAAFAIFSHISSQEPHGNAWDQARTAYRLAEAFFEIRKERMNENG
jgi:hypothetical protein